jgi:hypothetical protein
VWATAWESRSLPGVIPKARVEKSARAFCVSAAATSCPCSFPPVPSAVPPPSERGARAINKSTVWATAWERAPAAMRAGVGPRERSKRSLPGVIPKARVEKSARAFFYCRIAGLQNCRKDLTGLQAVPRCHRRFRRRASAEAPLWAFGSVQFIGSSGNMARVVRVHRQSPAVKDTGQEERDVATPVEPQIV